FSYTPRAGYARTGSLKLLDSQNPPGPLEKRPTRMCFVNQTRATRTKTAAGPKSGGRHGDCEHWDHSAGDGGGDLRREVAGFLLDAFAELEADVVLEHDRGARGLAGLGDHVRDRGL